MHWHKYDAKDDLKMSVLLNCQLAPGSITRVQETITGA